MAMSRRSTRFPAKATLRHCVEGHFSKLVYAPRIVVAMELQTRLQAERVHFKLRFGYFGVYSMPRTMFVETWRHANKY
jgi:hypothetical protein